MIVFRACLSLAALTIIVVGWHPVDSGAPVQSFTEVTAGQYS